MNQNSSLKLFKRINNWQEYFWRNQHYFKSNVGFIAQGGTIDSIRNEKNKLVPYPHPVVISKTSGKKVSNISKLYLKHQISAKILGDLFGWTSSQGKDVFIPWKDLGFKIIKRISSFDSGQEDYIHFLSCLEYAMKQLENLEILVISQGTDSLVNKASLFTTILSPYLYASHKKVIFVGSSESGYSEKSLAIPNVTGALFTAIENRLPGGVYIVTASRIANKPIIEVFQGLGAVKLHSDSIFHSPNSEAIFTIRENSIYKSVLLKDLIERIKNIELLPYLSRFYFRDHVFDRLEEAFAKTSIESVENDPKILATHYNMGKRVFIIRARGSGTAPLSWRKNLELLSKKNNVIIIITTSADSGDVNLKKYAAGLDIEGVISGRTLREEAALTLAAISYDLKINEKFNHKDIQQLIERYCYLSGMIGD